MRALGAMLALAIVGGLAACSAPLATVVPRSSATVAFDEPITSMNARRAGEATEMNRDLASAVLSGFSVVDAEGERVFDASFGSIAVVSEDPLTVRYTVADPVRWSDGTPLDAVDLLLAWAAECGRFAGFEPAETDDGLAQATAEPRISADRKSLTVVYDRDVDWAAQFEAVLPAHVAVRESLGAASPDAAKDAAILAIERAIEGDESELDAIAGFWNDGFSIDAGPEVLVSSGPYVISSVIPDQAVLLRPNVEYIGDHRPRFDRLRLVTLGPMAALQGISAGEVQLASLTPTDEVRAAVAGMDVDVFTGSLDAARFIVMERSALSGVAFRQDGTAALWNVWNWAPRR